MNLIEAVRMAEATGKTIELEHPDYQGAYSKNMTGCYVLTPHAITSDGWKVVDKPKPNLKWGNSKSSHDWVE